VAGTRVAFCNGQPTPFSSYNQPFFVLSSGLSSTTCELSLTAGGSPITVTGSTSCSLYTVLGSTSGGGGAILTTTAGTPTGLSYSVNTATYSGGTTAVGSTSAALGYGGLDAYNNNLGKGGAGYGLLNSVCVAISQLGSGGDPNNNVGLYTNGLGPYGSGISTGLTFNTSFNVTLSYDGTNLSMTMQATSGGTTFTHSWPVNIPQIVGASTAYVGFTGGSGGAYGIQSINNWTMS